MTIQSQQRGLQTRGQLQRVQFATRATALLGHVFADVFPQVAEHRHLFTGDVLSHRHTRQLDNAAFDGVHQREVAHGPGEQRAFGIARATEEERRGRQVHDTRHAQLAVDGLKSGNPQTCGFVVFLGFFLFVALQVFIIIGGRLLTVAVMRLVVDNQNVLHAHQVRHDALQHLAFGFQGQRSVAGAALQQLAATFGQLNALTHLEGVVVRDDDLGFAHVVEHVVGQQLTVFVIAVRVVGLQDAQTVLDGQARRADQKATGEVLAGWSAHSIDGLPGDQHGHDGGLAGTRCELECQTHQFRVGVFVGTGKMVKQ